MLLYIVTDEYIEPTEPAELVQRLKTISEKWFIGEIEDTIVLQPQQYHGEPEFPLTAENIEKLFQSRSMIIIDVDGYLSDYWEVYSYRPRIIVL